jgi:hypothetical protein
MSVRGGLLPARGPLFVASGQSGEQGFLPRLSPPPRQAPLEERAVVLLPLGGGGERKKQEGGGDLLDYECAASNTRITKVEELEGAVRDNGRYFLENTNPTLFVRGGSVQQRPLLRCRVGCGMVGVGRSVWAWVHCATRWMKDNYPLKMMTFYPSCGSQLDSRSPRAESEG